MNCNKNFLLAVFSLVGTTIGAGIFSLPYVFFKAGFIIGFLEFIFLIGIVLFVQLIYGEIVLKVKGKKRFISYTEEYLGHRWKLPVTISVTFGGIGVLLVYIILAGYFLSFIFNLSAFIGSLIFSIILFLLILSKPKMFGGIELIFGFSVILIVILISSLNVGYINIGNFIGFNVKNILLPYGVILFAISGYYVIPEMEDILGAEKKKMKKAIIYGTLIPAAVYMFFVLIVLGVSGALTSQDAISGLSNVLNSKFIILFGSILGLLAVTEASLSQGIFIKETFLYDLEFNKWLSWIMTGLAPLVLFLLGARNLIAVIGIVGALFFAFHAVIILLIHKKLKSQKIESGYEIKLPNFLYYLIGSFVILGAIVEAWYIIF